MFVTLSRAAWLEYHERRRAIRTAWKSGASADELSRMRASLATWARSQIPAQKGGRWLVPA